MCSLLGRPIPALILSGVMLTGCVGTAPVMPSTGSPASTSPSTVDNSASTSPTAESPATSVVTTPSTSATDGEPDGIAVDPEVVFPTPAPGETAEVDVVVTRWGLVDEAFEASAVINGVLVEDATCTLVLTRGSNRVTAAGPVVLSATSSVCARGLTIPARKLASGSWSMWISFSAEGFSGRSPAVEVIIE